MVGKFLLIPLVRINTSKRYPPSCIAIMFVRKLDILDMLSLLLQKYTNHQYSLSGQNMIFLHGRRGGGWGARVVGGGGHQINLIKKNMKYVLIKSDIYISYWSKKIGT